MASNLKNTFSVSAHNRESTIQGTLSEVSLEDVYAKLLSWCRERDFAGYDPYDALNSRLLQSTPLVRLKIARLLLTQLVKRSPLDLRALLFVPPERNSKGMALFSLSQLANHRRMRTAASEMQARALLADLISMRLEGFSGAAWGYNFDWQSRNFFAPRGTPTIVPTAFAARALTEAASVFQDEEYLSIARSVCEFILNDLSSTEFHDDQISFSYTPRSDTRIFNASLLAGEVLAGVGSLTGEDVLLAHAEKAARYVIRNQREDGSWTYGTESSQAWVDNFHTGFVLFSLKRIIDSCALGTEFQQALERGYFYWKETFFLADGWPKYYHDDPYPADIHASACAVLTFLELSDLDSDSVIQAQRVVEWTIRNLRDERGFFYYQKRRFLTLRTPFMRWGQAWMLYALSRLLEMSDKLQPVAEG